METYISSNTIKTLVKSALKKHYEILSVEKTSERRYDGKLLDDNGIEFKYILRFTFRNDRIYSFSVDIYNQFNSWRGEEIVCEHISAAEYFSNK